MDTRVGPTTRIEHRRDHPDRRFEGNRSCQCSEDVEQLFKAAVIISVHIPLDEDTNSLVRFQSVRDVKELNLIPPLLFVKKEPRMLDTTPSSGGGRGNNARGNAFGNAKGREG